MSKCLTDQHILIKCRLAVRNLQYINRLLKVYKSTSSSKLLEVKIGDVSITRGEPKHPELVPLRYVCKRSPQTILHHLRWIMQKDILKQDIFLIGPPGPLKRAVVMQYLELTNKEVEYISLSRDTTESDIKQRREIKDKTAHYIDQCAVRAAIEGRVLVLEGIEKAERNVLPILNNLLENREMQLEDGRFLMAAERYDKLLQEHSKEELESWKLVRVSEDFRVIALGLPVPRYQGNPLDPPLRSRFQARDVNPLPFQEHLTLLSSFEQPIPPEKLTPLLSFAYTMLSSESQSLNLPDFPTDQLPALVKILKAIPSASISDLLHRLYPHSIFLGKEGQVAVVDTLKRFSLDRRHQSDDNIAIANISKGSDDATAVVSFKTPSNQVEVKVLAGLNPEIHSNTDDFVTTNYHKNLLSQLMQSHIAKDFCIIGPKGCGKTALVNKFASMLNYELEPVILYQDMTARDLLQQRSTTPSGNTVWRDMPLISAALEGKIAILDGLHRVNAGTLAVIHRLVHDRELQLFDGNRILRQDRYEKLKSEQKLTDADLKARGIFKMHPAFRLIALAEPPVVGSSTQQWLNPEILTLFLYHTMRPLSLGEETEVVCGANVPDKMKSILEFTHNLRNTDDATIHSLAPSLSVRQLLRIARRLKKYPEEDASDAIQRACLSRFLPSLTKLALLRTLQDANLQPIATGSSSIEDLDKAITSEVKDGIVRIGRTTAPVFKPPTKTKVPNVLFYDNAQHLAVMEDMLKDFVLGEHLLLIGNQGVGKNKIVDRFLHLLNRPREYIQLHRDTTVQTLTLQPTVQDGVIIYEDSPLVRAVKLGHVLVVDEADKAPTHVTCILKTLVESGDMILADGRRIVVGSQESANNKRNVIQMHPDFRLIVLANRPGFPFLGNDFFGALGDTFSCHAVDNPSMDSEVEMLQKYGPRVPKHILQKLVEAFSELRTMADEGLIAYPYSTREVVNIVKHLQAYPDEGLATVVRNVFDFDPYNNETWETLLQTLHKHGIPIGAKKTNVDLAKEFPLPEPNLVSKWQIVRSTDSVNGQPLVLPIEKRNFQLKKPKFVRIEGAKMDREDARSLIFTEEQSHWNIPIEDRNVVVDVAVTHNGDPMKDIIHVATGNPVQLFSMNAANRFITWLDLYSFYYETRGGYRPQVKIAPLGDQLKGTVALHEAITNKLFLVEPTTGAVQQIQTDYLHEYAGKQITQRIQNFDKGFYRFCRQFADNNLLIFYQVNGSAIEALDVAKGVAFELQVPFNLGSVHPVTMDRWLLVDNNTGQKHVVKDPLGINRDSTPENKIYKLSEDPKIRPVSVMSKNELRPFALSAALGQKITSPNRIFVNPTDFANVIVGFPELESDIEVHSFKRDNAASQKVHSDSSIIHGSSIFLTQPGQIVTLVPPDYSPELVDQSKLLKLSGFLEVVDLIARKVRYVPVPEPESTPPFTSWLKSISPTLTVMAETSNDGVVTVDAGGNVRLWETGTENIERSLSQWRDMIGHDSDRPIQLTIEQPNVGEITEPKHGKEDPLNTPHVGGNIWAGGTGGRSTAGLGGVGGPYRLDAGNPVYQVPDSVKAAVPEEVKKAARAMGLKAFKERLQQIKMTDYDADLFEKLHANVHKQVQSLHVILDSLQAKTKERQWLRHQTSGELDDTKLIEGLTGEKAIYKRRGDHDPEMGAPLEKPKRLTLLTDVSGSMYRFNGYDGRLQRSMESALLVMQAFENYPTKFKYDIVGHSGEAFEIPFVKSDTLPANNKEKLDILKTMHAHAQFCMSGDNTLEATINAINTLANEDADERFVVVLSDANLDRYGISPTTLARALTANSQVNAFAIFIGSLGDQAQRLKKSLPPGHGFVCMDTKLIPEILRQIFTSTLLAK